MIKDNFDEWKKWNSFKNWRFMNISQEEMKEELLKFMQNKIKNFAIVLKKQFNSFFILKKKKQKLFKKTKKNSLKILAIIKI